MLKERKKKNGLTSHIQILVNSTSVLNRIPGSLKHKLSEWPLVIAITKGKIHVAMVDLHRQCSPIVLLVPGMIGVSDPETSCRIIVTEDWSKSHVIYANFRQDPERPTLLAFTSKRPTLSASDLYHLLSVFNILEEWSHCVWRNLQCCQAGKWTSSKRRHSCQGSCFRGAISTIKSTTAVTGYE